MSDLITYKGYRPYLPPEPIGGSVKTFSGAKIDEFINRAKEFLGQSYLWGGGHSSKTGIQRVDCSGLITQAARMSGLNLDGTAAMQQRMGKPVDMSDLKAGDLLFKGNPASHVGIYLGGGKALHSPRTGDVVKIIDLKDYSGFDNARRVFDNAEPAPQPAAKPPEAAPAPAPTPAPAPAPTEIAPINEKITGPGGTMVTVAGDTLWKIAQRTLGDPNRWREIYDLNQGAMPNANIVFPGTTLQLPGGAQVAAPATVARSAGIAQAAPVSATVAPSDLRAMLVAMRDQVRGLLGGLEQITPTLRAVMGGMKPNA